MPAPILDIQDLSVSYRTPSRVVSALGGIDLSLGNERMGIVGESGSGKSTLGRAIMRLLAPSATIAASRFKFRDIDLLATSEAEMCRIRGRRISMVLQDPKHSLNPMMTIGDQISESYRVHHRASRAEARERALAMLDAVQIRQPSRVYDLYPREVSGGMGQRAMIAMMLIPEPELLIADEPTSALDITVRSQLLKLLDKLVSDRGMSLIIISHDLNMVARFCDRVMIMYGGRVMETCKAGDLAKARHEYTRGLLACRPLLSRSQTVLPTVLRSSAWLNDLGKSQR
jgi:peptide/nickel transport system ATP-binding protein